MNYVLFIVDVMKPNDLIKNRYLVRVDIDNPPNEMDRIACETVQIALANEPEAYDIRRNEYLVSKPLEWDWHPRVAQIW